jgi:glycosyltransferase involved in cell wall biosynthesis
MNYQLSVVIPVFNEELSIPNLLFALDAVLDTLDITSQVIIINDGSTDKTEYILKHSKMKNSDFIPVTLLSNQGQQTAIEVGLNVSKGEYVLTMDADLQHPPSLIPEMWKLRDNAGIVSMVQKNRKEFIIKRVMSNFFYRILSFISGMPLIPSAGDFRLIRRDKLNFLLSLSEPKIIRFLLAKYRIPQTHLEFIPEKRILGKSKYNFFNMLKLGISSVTLVTTIPLIISSYLTFMFGVATLLNVLYILFVRLKGDALLGWASLAVVFSGTMTIVMLALTIISVYIKQITEHLFKPNIKSLIKN